MEKKTRDPEVIMRFYNNNGQCFVCETECQSVTEVKKHLLYKHLIVVDNRDHDAFHFVQFRILKPRVIDSRHKPEPKLICDLCGDINRFKVVQHKIDKCPSKREQDNWDALQHGVNNMSFEIALVEQVYKNLNEA